MIPYPIFLELQTKMNEVSQLTENLLKTSGSFYLSSMKYISELQKFADEHNLYISSDIATALEKIIVFRHKKTEIVSARINQRKEKDTYAVEVLEELIDKVKNFLTKDSKSFEECEDVWRQLLSRLLCNNLLSEMSFANEEKINCIIEIIKNNQELLPYYSHILGLVGIVNSRILLDRTMPQLEL